MRVRMVGVTPLTVPRMQSATAVLPESRLLLPGDALITTCTYNTSARNTTTSFGPGPRDEM